MNDNIMNIAVIVAGIDEEYQFNIMKGINSYAKDNNANIAHFAAFGGVLANSSYDIGEYNIYNLINFDRFDGAILLTNTISAPDVKKKITERIKESGIPSVVFDCDDYPEFYNIGVDNFKAMQDIVRHIIDVHKITEINFISGPLANPEASARYDAYLSVLSEKGIAIESFRTYFGEFRGVDGKRGIEKFLENNDRFPKAIICANDAMALTAVTTLEKNGYRVPEDVIVTGFDNTYNARNFSPELTSVKRPLYEIGYKACEMISGIINGIKQPKETFLSTTPIFSESCGCKNSDMDSDIKAYKKNAYKVIEDCCSHISLLNRITSSLAESVTAEDNFDVITQYLDEINCEKFYLCFCDDWQGRFTQQVNDNDCISVEEYHINGYTKQMSVPIAWKNGVGYSIDNYSSEDMYPEEYETGGNVSYFMPIHFRDRCLGYCVITNSDFPLQSRLFHTWIMNISNSIENIRKLQQLNTAVKELDKLYVVDPLCNIFNRNGFVRASGNIFKDCIRNHHDITIMFIDMDGLKIINDEYGHKEGDFALKTLADILSSCCENGEICARFGGDEFLIFSATLTNESANKMIEKIRRKMEEVNKTLDKPYEVGASIGCYITEAKEEIPLFKIITKADEKMYEEKKRKKTSRYLRHT